MGRMASWVAKILGGPSAAPQGREENPPRPDHEQARLTKLEQAVTAYALYVVGEDNELDRPDAEEEPRDVSDLKPGVLDVPYGAPDFENRAHCSALFFRLRASLRELADYERESSYDPQTTLKRGATYL